VHRLSDNIEFADMQHGGNLSYISANFPRAPKPYIDLSTGINPYPYTLPLANPEWQNRLSDSAEILAARVAAANYYGTNLVNTHLGAGMQPLLFAIATEIFRERGAQKISIFSPTYSEYEKIFSAAGHEISRTMNNEQRITIICNPNNPDGRIIPRAKILQMADELAKKNGILIVDEANVDCVPELSVASEVYERENLIVLNGIGKFFGLAGARVSVAITPTAWEEKLQKIIGSWPIATPICLQLPVMFSDTNWQTQMRARLQQESQNWREILAEHFTIVAGTPLFTLVTHEKCDIWHKKLAEQGVLIRKFMYNTNWLRFSLPKFNDLQRIITVLNS